MIILFPGRKYFIRLFPVFFLILYWDACWALTLNEAIDLAKKNLPSYRAAMAKVDSAKELYKASLSPYLPSLDLTAARTHELESLDEYLSTQYDATISYTLYDWGRRKANRRIALLNFETSRESLRLSQLELELDVKVAFYSALASKEIVDERRLQLTDAQKDHEVARGRNRLGVAKLSDVLQASVRLEQAKFNLTEAEGAFRKVLSELNSLLGRPLDYTYDVEGSLDIDVPPPDRKRLFEATLQTPEIRQAEKSVEVSEGNKALVLSEFYPDFSMDVSYTKTDLRGPADDSNETKTASIIARWNLFELGKFFRKNSSELEIRVSEKNLQETKRQLLLNVNKAYEDFLTASTNLNVAREQLKQAEHNYSQAFGEYKVGKGDILSLVQAESFLAHAREQLTASRLNIMVSKAVLERAAGIERLEQLLN
jgi:outer membrane protein